MVVLKKLDAKVKKLTHSLCPEDRANKSKCNILQKALAFSPLIRVKRKRKRLEKVAIAMRPSVLTEKVVNHEAVCEPPSGLPTLKIPSIRSEVGFCYSGQVSVRSNVSCGVPKHKKGWNLTLNPLSKAAQTLVLQRQGSHEENSPPVGPHFQPPP